MLDKAIKVVKVEERFRFKPLGGTEKLTVYHFTIGDHGPFSEEFGAGNATPEHIHRTLNARARELRETGALLE